MIELITNNLVTIISIAVIIPVTFMLGNRFGRKRCGEECGRLKEENIELKDVIRKSKDGLNEIVSSWDVFGL